MTEIQIFDLPVTQSAYVASPVCRRVQIRKMNPADFPGKNVSTHFQVLQIEGLF